MPDGREFTVATWLRSLVGAMITADPAPGKELAISALRSLVGAMITADNATVLDMRRALRSLVGAMITAGAGGETRSPSRLRSLVGAMITAQPSARLTAAPKCCDPS